jgi:protein KRI1
LPIIHLSQVGNLPTRFNYTAVEPDAFSLTPAEILLATDKELNEYRSIKKYAPYRTRKTKWDPKKGEKLKELKKQVASRAPHDWLPAEVARSRKQEGKKRIGKKERQRLKVGQIEGAAKGESDELTGGKRARAETPDEEIPIQKKRKRRKKNKGVS